MKYGTAERIMGCLCAKATPGHDIFETTGSDPVNTRAVSIHNQSSPFIPTNQERAGLARPSVTMGSVVPKTELFSRLTSGSFVIANNVI